jgi:hypothetical protein
MQLKIKFDHEVIEWILYNQFDEIKETGKNDFATIYSAIWKDGSLSKNYYGEYTRKSNKGVALKCLHNSQDTAKFVINEVKRISTIL